MSGVDFRKRVDCPSDILRKAASLHSKILKELRKRKLLPAGKLTPEQECVLDGVVVNWQIEPQQNRKGFTGRLNFRVSGFLHNEPSGGHDSVTIVGEIVRWREVAIKNKKRLEEAQIEWDRREALKVELKREFPSLILGHNSLGIYIYPDGNIFLPLGKEREALEMALRHREEWERLIKSAPRQESLTGYDIVRKPDQEGYYGG